MKNNETGHASNKRFQEQNRLIISFCNDKGLKSTQTASSIIIEHNRKSIDIKSKTRRFTDLRTNISDDYFNPIARIIMFFNIKMT